LKAEILKRLREAGGYVSGQELCESLGVSRTAVWKCIRQLEDEGYVIEAVRNRGYRLEDSGDVLSEQELGKLLSTRWLGKNLAVFDEVDSTNNEARRMAEKGAGEMARYGARLRELREKLAGGEAGSLPAEQESG
jgi:BirA family biotin operon repressor/biotin-[acetyl-CoA-carboxylase] ligase